MSQDKADFKLLNQDLLSRAETLLQQWFPAGKVRGREFVCGNIDGASGDSFSVNLDKGVWKDFSGGPGGGDLISLYAKMKGLKNIQAYNELSGRPAKKKLEIRFKETYVYNADYRVDRVEFEDGTKAFFGKYKGTNKQHPVPRPIYAPEGYNPEKPFLIVEGEKSAHAAAKIAGKHYNVITWPVGSNSYNKADWPTIKGKGLDVALIWPDADAVGFKAAAGIAAILKKLNFQVSILDVRKNDLFPSNPGWDAADFLKLKKTEQEFIEWGKSCKVSVLELPEEPKPEPEAPKAEPKKTETPPPPKEKPKSNPGEVLLPQPPRDVEVIEEPEEEELDSESPAHFQDLKSKLSATNAGKIHANAANAQKILMYHPLFRGRIFYDTFYDKPFLLDGEELRPIDDVDLITYMTFMQTSGIENMAKTHVMDAINAVANLNKISQPKMEIESYVWDGQPRIESFFTDYIVSNYDQTYLAAVGKNLWISLIARIFDPGCKVDTMVVIESKHEGIFKSSALKIIGGKYFIETNGKIGTKEFLENTQGYFLLEDDELNSIIDAGANRQRSFLSRSSDTFRAAYGRFSKEKKRQYVIVGTTNEDKYINARNSDGRRFWPVKAEQVHLNKIKEDREQLFAEARDRFLKGETWWDIPKDIHAEIFNQKNEGYIDDSWEEEIAEFFENAHPYQEGWFKTKDVLKNILMVPVDRQTKQMSMKTSKILRELGFEYKNLNANTKRWTKDHFTKPFDFTQKTKQDFPGSDIDF